MFLFCLFLFRPLTVNQEAAAEAEAAAAAAAAASTAPAPRGKGAKLRRVKEKYADQVRRGESRGLCAYILHRHLVDVWR